MLEFEGKKCYYNVIDLVFLGRLIVSDYTEIKEQIQQLVDELEGEKTKKSRSFDKVMDNCKRKKDKSAIANSKPSNKGTDLQELLDYLRIYVKYDIYDRQATRRENKFLRCLLSRKNRGQ